MSCIKIEKMILKNFKCHNNFETDIKQLNILTGSNASGKSSFVQALLLAFKSWEECEKKKIGTNKIYGMNLGIPLNIVSEDLEQKNITEEELQLVLEELHKSFAVFIFAARLISP